MSINATFRFHAVGQGLFYSGILNNVSRGQHGMFSFVYDCGTKSSRTFLRREIDDFKAVLRKGHSKNAKKLDLLILSHFHDDHINGLEYLLENLEVDTVVIPYMDPVSLLMARSESSGEDAFLMSFYADPIEWLTSQSVNRVLLIGSPISSNAKDNGFYSDREYQTYVLNDYVRHTTIVNGKEIKYLTSNPIIKTRTFQWKFVLNNLNYNHSGYPSYRDVVDNFLNDKLLSLDFVLSNDTLTKQLARKLKDCLPKDFSINRTLRGSTSWVI